DAGLHVDLELPAALVHRGALRGDAADVVAGTQLTRHGHGEADGARLARAERHLRLVELHPGADLRARGVGVGKHDPTGRTGHTVQRIETGRARRIAGVGDQDLVVNHLTQFGVVDEVRRVRRLRGSG